MTARHSVTFTDDQRADEALRRWLAREAKLAYREAVAWAELDEGDV